MYFLNEQNLPVIYEDLLREENVFILKKTESSAASQFLHMPADIIGLPKKKEKNFYQQVLVSDLGFQTISAKDSKD
jgi:hypothetical protein